MDVHNLYFGFLILVSEFYWINCWTASAEKGARSAKLATNVYDKLVRPSEQVTMEVGFHLLAINELNIKTQQFSVTGWITMEWEDERLEWSLGDHDTEVFFAYDSEVWKPELFVDNALADVSILNDPNLQFRVENTGKVEWELPKIFYTHCDVDVQYFPFDSQDCIVELTSWAYSINELVLKPLYEEVKTEDMQKNGEWSVKSSKTETRNLTETKPGGSERTYSVIDFQVTIKRNPAHYISSTILPILATNILSVLVFVLPVESGEKVGYTLTVLLAEAVLLTLVQDAMPSSSQHTSYLSVYLALTLCIGVVCVALTVLVIRTHQRSPNIPVSKWIKTAVLKVFIPLSCWRGCCCCLKKGSHARPNSASDDAYLDEKRGFDDFPDDHLFSWTEVSAVMDWFFFVLIGSITLVITVIIFMIIIIGGSTK